MKNKDAAKLLIRVIVDNNPTGVVNSLFDNKIIVEDVSQLKNVLYNIYLKNTPLFRRILKGVKYDMSAKNYTTEENFVKLMKPSAENMRVTDTANAKEWYNEVLDTLSGGSSTVTTQTTVDEKPSSAGNTTTIIVAIAAFAVIGGLIWYLSKK